MSRIDPSAAVSQAEYVREFWRRRLWHGEWDRDDAGLREGIRWLYAFLRCEAPQFVLILESPLQAHISVPVLRWGGLLGQGSRAAARATSLRTRIASETAEAVTSGGLPVGARLRLEERLVPGELRTVPILASSERRALARTVATIDRQVATASTTLSERIFAAMWNGLIETHDAPDVAGAEVVGFRDQALGLDGDLSWIVFHDLLERLGHPRREEARRLRGLAAAGLWSARLFDNVAILVRAPRFLRLDDRRRLHALDGPAHAWDDGFEEYRVHGVSLPADTVLESHRLTAREVLDEPNAERRRAMLDLVGPHRFIAELAPDVVDADVDGSGQPRRLFHIVDGMEDMTLVEVRCPSTGHSHFLRVPPQIRRCAEAVAWTFDRPESDYAPLVEA